MYVYARPLPLDSTLAYSQVHLEGSLRSWEIRVQVQHPLSEASRPQGPELSLGVAVGVVFLKI